MTKTPVCPVCSRPPIFVLAGTQAFCGNDECRVLMWDPSKDRDDLLAKEDRIEWDTEEGR